MCDGGGRELISEALLMTGPLGVTGEMEGRGGEGQVLMTTNTPQRPPHL